MLYTITLITSLLFAFLYPLCFWISAKEPLKNNFHHFHLGLPTIIGFIALIFVIRMNVSLQVSILCGIWMAAAIGITAYYWTKETVNPGIVSVLTLLGLLITYFVHAQLISADIISFLISILGGLIFVASLFVMNLGHWYLNVHGLPIKHLRNSAYILWILIALRAAWDIVIILTKNTIYQGDTMRIYQFIGQLDGFLLLIPIFFGIIFPGIALFMVKEIIRLKNTQAATGVLYVILCAVLLADMSYKYYLIKYGIVL